MPNLNRAAEGASAAPGRRPPAASSALAITSSRCPQYSSASCSSARRHAALLELYHTMFCEVIMYDVHINKLHNPPGSAQPAPRVPHCRRDSGVAAGPMAAGSKGHLCNTAERVHAWQGRATMTR